MSSLPEDLDVSLLTYDDIAEIDLEISEHELSLFQKALAFIELVLVGYLLVWSIWAVVSNAQTVIHILTTSFIF